MTSEPERTDGGAEMPAPDLTARQTYNVVTDTITGPNIRLRDNLIQAVIIALCLILGAVIGAVAVEDRGPGALVGAFCGLLIGLFGSGFFLMIYRTVLHARGRHD